MAKLTTQVDLPRAQRTNASAQGAAAGGSSESVTNLIDGQHWILQMGEVPYARKKSQFRAHSFGELYSHLLVDVEVFPKRPSRAS